MKNLINVDGWVIGYKEDLINYLKQESTRVRLDQTIDNEDALYCMQQTNDALQDLENYDDLTLLGVGENWNSDFVVKEVGIEF